MLHMNLERIADVSKVRDCTAAKGRFWDKFFGVLPQLVYLAMAFTVAPCVADEQSLFQFVEKHCFRCHSDMETSGDLNLQELSSRGVKTLEINRETWEIVASKLSAGEMPPDDSRPAADDVLSVTDWLEAEFDRQDRAVAPFAGSVTARRLNRSEYNNTIRDLLGVDLQPAKDFPPDQAAFGFDNISDALRLSPVLFEKYLNAAERAVRTAVFGPAKLKPAMTHYPFPVRINLRRGQQSLPDDLYHYDETGLSTIHSAHVVHFFPVDAEYRFRIVLNGHRPNQSEPVRPALYIDGVPAKEFEVDATDLEGQVVEARVKVAAGERLLSATYLKTYHGLPPHYNGPEPSKRSPEPLLSKGGRGKLTQRDIEILRKYGTKIKTDTIEKRVDNRFESIDIGGPFNQRTTPAPESLEKIFVCGHDHGGHTADCGRVILANFAGRAFRRPATTQEVDALLRLVELVQEQGDSFEEGIATALQAVLVSPHFLFRVEQGRTPSDDETSVPLTDYELASRLSYFLWSSMPDAELLKLAAENQLRQPRVLADQVRRMLKDEKSQSLVENFIGQWLQLKNLEVVRPDAVRFPKFEDSLRRSMRYETERFIQEIIREDRSVLEILDADYTFVDERLARFYGIEGVEGPEFRKVDMSGLRRGGGVLSHASILTISSYSTRTSPVLRGKWILENILNAPPPPPPPSVPELDEAELGETVSLREQMELHRKDPACAACHSRMDPLGFGLEHFDAIGAWRAQDGKTPVDASGTLPNGQTFRGHHELKQILMNERDDFVEGLAEKLLIYALGRGLERYDRPAVTTITSRLAAADYRFSVLVLGIVNSLPFQMRSTAEHAVLTQTGEVSP